MTEMVSELRYEVSAKTAKVTVTARPITVAPGVCFTMKADYPDKGGKLDGDDLQFNSGEGAFELTFKLDDDDTGLNLAFYPDFVDAMWVAVGQTCPKIAGDGNGAITAKSVADKKLVVMNANAVSQTLTFALRFTGNASPLGNPPYVYDPRIINGGGGFVEEDGGDDEEEDRRREQGE